MLEIKEELKQLLKKEAILDYYYWSTNFDEWSEQSLENINLDNKEEVFQYQMKVYNELGLYIPFAVISPFIYGCVTEHDCTWCSSNIDHFGTLDQFQRYLIKVLKGVKPKEAYEEVSTEDYKKRYNVK